jgi:hypothetical protein
MCTSVHVWVINMHEKRQADIYTDGKGLVKHRRDQRCHSSETSQTDASFGLQTFVKCALIMRLVQK